MPLPRSRNWGLGSYCQTRSLRCRAKERIGRAEAPVAKDLFGETIKKRRPRYEAALAGVEKKLCQSVPRGFAVAHSAGAFVATLFADKRPGDVVGMVLLDPAIPDQTAIRQRIAPKWGASGNSGPTAAAQRLQQCAAELRSGSLKPNSPEFDQCTTPPLPPEFSALSATLAHLNADPARLLTQASALTSVNSGSPRQAINPHRSYGNMPMIVLTAGQHPFPPDMPAGLRQQIELYFQALASGHRATILARTD